MARCVAKMSDVSKDMHMEISISGVRVFTFRVWLATKLIQLAAFVFPFDVTVNGPEVT